MIFCVDAVKNREKKRNEDDFVFLDAVDEGEFLHTLQRLASLEPKFYGG